MRRLHPPQGGEPPPESETLPDGSVVALRPLAERVTAAYFDEFPDDGERYGDAGRAWCLHDTQFLLAWLIQGARLRTPIFEQQLRWLAQLLAARGYPVGRLDRHIELVADEVTSIAAGGAALAAHAREAKATAL
jgi:hypothetical protein